MSDQHSAFDLLAAEAAILYVQNATDDANAAFYQMTPNEKRLTLSYWLETDRPGNDWRVNWCLAIQLRLSIKGKIG
jgi:hypothetical protein